MITYFSFHPEHFNNNGDQGNIQVLGVEFSVAGEQFEQTDELDSAAFVMFGDASRAAMRHYAAELESLRDTIANRFEGGLPTLVVGSCYEFFAPQMGLETTKIPRRSEFVLDGENFGYRNTELDLPALTASGSFFGTSLFGPFLAKNPEALTALIRKLGSEPRLSRERIEYVKEIRRRSSAG